MAELRVLVVGSGGREHALAWRLARDPEVREVLVAPGNDGIGRDFPRLPIGERDAAGLIQACRDRAVDLAVIGPEAPLAAGVADEMNTAGITTFGPSRAAARLESSKWFAKEVMAEAGVPTARAERCTDPAQARTALERFGPPWVVKADGLAAGKGVCVSESRSTVERFLIECLETGRFGASGRCVVVEEFLRGEEASVMALCDGERYVLLPPARDHKRAFDGEGGPNTGGMGAYAPTQAVPAELERRIGETIVAPLLAAMSDRGTPYRGALYCGLMIDREQARVVEFNCRFGDPESEVVLPLLAGPFAAHLAGAARGELDPTPLPREAGTALAVALVDEGYPDAVRGGGTLAGLDALMESDQVTVFHAGTAFEEGRWRVRGGRAAYVVARGADRAEAASLAYRAIAHLGGNGWRCRHDIGGGVAKLEERAR
jgi:phosphoribosylamine--glycine ligase